MARVFSYARVSSDRQVVSGYGLARQDDHLNEIREWCEQNGDTLANDDIMRDAGLSGFYGENLLPTAHLGRFLKRVEEGRIPRGSWLVVEHLNRLSRQDVRKALALLLLLINAGINIKTWFDRKEYTENSQTIDADLIIAIIYMSEAYKASEAKRTYSIKLWQTKRAAAAEKLLTKTRPAWIDIINGKFVVNAKKGAIILSILGEVASGFGTYTLARRLNDDVVPPQNGDKWFRDKQTRERVKPVSTDWNKSRINNIVHSDSLLGWMQPHIRVGKSGRRPEGPPIKDYYPIIPGITQTLVDRARAQIASRRANVVVDGVVVKRPLGAGRKGEVLSNLFTGLARCAVCGGSMFLANRDIARNKPGWLRCTKAVRNRHQCTNTKSVPYAVLERDIIDSVGLSAIEAGGLEQGTVKDRLGDQIAQNVAEMAKIDAAIANMSLAFANGIPPLLVRRITEMQERHSALAKETEDLRTKKALEGSRPSMHQIALQMLNDLHSPDAKNVLVVRARIMNGLRQVLEVVWCCPDRDVIVRFRGEEVVVVTRHCLKDSTYHRWHLDFEQHTDEPVKLPFLPSHEEKMEDSLYRKVMGYERFSEADLNDWLEESEIVQGMMMAPAQHAKDG